jgi:hypothetical protein
MEWGQYLARGTHESVQNIYRSQIVPIVAMKGKPMECLQVETNIFHKSGDAYIITFPKTGTTLVQFICHLLRCGADHQSILFDDIHQVVPHTSSSWFINQELNVDQPGLCRLFKTHRMIEQIAGISDVTKFIATIRDPTDTLISVYEHSRVSGRFRNQEISLKEYARSDKWLKAHLDGCVGNIWDTFLSFWRCR